MAKPKRSQARTRERAQQHRAKAEPPRVSARAPARPDPHGATDVVFDATIPDHVAIAAGLELMEKRYGGCRSYFPIQVRRELQRAAAVLPPLQDALRAPWLLNFEVTIGDLAVIEQMREDAFGETDPERGLGECVVLHMAKQMNIRVGIDDTVARQMAKKQKLKVFGALQVVQALYRYCGITKGEAWNLYDRLVEGNGRRGSRLTSIEDLSRTKLEKYVANSDESYA